MRTNQSIPPHRQGFTLVELLVVIVIVAALSTLGFLGMQRAMDNANKTKSIINVRQLVSASQIFSSDNNGILLDWNDTSVNGQKRNWANHLLISLSPDLAENDAYKGSAGDRTAKGFGVFADPKALKKGSKTLSKTGQNSWRTFAYNNRIGSFDIGNNPVPDYKMDGVRFTHQVQAPNKLILFSQRVLSGNAYFAFLQPEDGANNNLEFSLYNGKVVVGFFDGHVDLFSKKNMPSQAGVSINPSTGRVYTESEWRLHWFGKNS